MKQLLRKKIGLIFICIQFLLTVLLSGMLLYVDLLPGRYLLPAVLLLVFLMLYTFFSQMAKRMYIIGRVLSGVFCVIMIVGMGYLWRGYSAIANMSDSNLKIDELSAIVLADDKADTIDDIKGYQVGILKDAGRSKTDEMLDNIEKDISEKLSVTEYDDSFSLVGALYSKEVGIIIFNEAYRDMILEEKKDFDTETKILGNHRVETVIEDDEEEKDEITKPFIMYCSGIDTYGALAKASRSDVNIIAVVNPQSGQILLVNTPRDYYVPLSISNGKQDKLTHAGIYGVDVSIETLEMLYDIDIDYYARVNFTGLIDIVDSLGGLNLYSDLTFKSDWGPSFVKGYNKVDGKQALAYCRQRKTFGDGDRQRGRNHQHLIEALLDKATSPAVLQKFGKLMDSLEGAFETNMKTRKITKFVKYQMDENPKWNVESISADGSNGSNYTYSMPNKKSYVMYPDQNSVELVKENIKRIIDGKKIKKENGKNQQTSTAKPQKR